MGLIAGTHLSFTRVLLLFLIQPVLSSTFRSCNCHHYIFTLIYGYLLLLVSIGDYCLSETHNWNGKSLSLVATKSVPSTSWGHTSVMLVKRTKANWTTSVQRSLPRKSGRNYSKLEWIDQNWMCQTWRCPFALLLPLIRVLPSSRGQLRFSGRSTSSSLQRSIEPKHTVEVDNPAFE